MNSKIMTIVILVLLCIALGLGVLVAKKAADSAQASESPSTAMPGDDGKSPGPTEENPKDPTPENGHQGTAGTDPTGGHAEEPTPAPVLSGIVIGIDPGHQLKGNSEKEPCAPWDPDKNVLVNNTTMKAKTTSGTAGKFTHRPEYVVNLEISLKIKAKLEALGATVFMTRETHDVDISNIERAVMCNEAGCDVVLRIHCDGAENPDARGVEAWVRGDGDKTEEYKALGTLEAKMAAELLREIALETGANNRGVKTSNDYTGLNWSTVPSIILECGFMSNEEEDNNLSDPEYQEKIASGIANWLTKTTLLEKKN